VLRENCKKERTPKATFVWECESEVEQGGSMGLLNWDWDNSIPITQYEGGILAAYEDDNCCSNSMGMVLEEAVTELYNFHYEQQGDSHAPFPSWFPKEYLPVMVDLERFERAFKEKERIPSLSDYHPHRELFPVWDSEDKYLDWVIIPSLPYDTEPYPLMMETLEGLGELGRRNRENFLRHFDFTDDMLNMEGAVGGIVLHVEVTPTKTSYNDFPQDDGFFTVAPSRFQRVEPVIRVIFLDENRERVENEEIVWMAPYFSYYKVEKRQWWLPVLVKMFAPSLGAYKRWAFKHLPYVLEEGYSV